MLPSTVNEDAAVFLSCRASTYSAAKEAGSALEGCAPENIAKSVIVGFYKFVK